MSLSTMVIGFLPKYQQIGIFAPIFLIICRLMQGLSTGGEYNGSAIYLIERFGKDKAGFIGIIITSSCVVGAIFGSIIGKYLIEIEISYRYAFIIGGSFGFILFYLRSYLPETEGFLTVTEMLKTSIWQYVKKYSLNN